MNSTIFYGWTWKRNHVRSHQLIHNPSKVHNKYNNIKLSIPNRLQVSDLTTAFDYYKRTTSVRTHFGCPNSLVYFFL